MDPKGAQMEPESQQTKPQGPPEYENHAKIVAPSVRMEPQGRPKCKKITNKCRKVVIRNENVPRGAEKHTWTQATHQRRKQRETRISKQANKRTNTPIHIYKNKALNNKTTRPLETSFELQTQTQTPAAGCSPKAT